MKLLVLCLENNKDEAAKIIDESEKYCRQYEADYVGRMYDIFFRFRTDMLISLERGDDEFNMNKNWFCLDCWRFFDVKNIPYYAVVTFAKFNCPYCNGEDHYHGHDAIEAKLEGKSMKAISRIILSQRPWYKYYKPDKAAIKEIGQKQTG